MNVEKGFSSEMFFIVVLPCKRESSTGIVFKQIKQMPGLSEGGRKDSPQRARRSTKKNILGKEQRAGDRSPTGVTIILSKRRGTND